MTPNPKSSEVAREIVHNELCYPKKDNEGYYLRDSLRTDEVIKCVAKALNQAFSDGMKESARQGTKIESAGEYFIIRPGMAKGRIWIGTTGGEGGDFDQD